MQRTYREAYYDEDVNPNRSPGEVDAVHHYPTLEIEEGTVLRDPKLHVPGGHRDPALPGTSKFIRNLMKANEQASKEKSPDLPVESVPVDSKGRGRELGRE